MKEQPVSIKVHNDDVLSPEALAAYVSGNASYEDSQRVESAVSSDTKALQRLRDYRYIWGAAGDLPVQVDSTAAWDDVVLEIIQRRRWRSRRRVAAVSAFASLSIVIGLVTLIVPRQLQKSPSNNAVATGQAYEYATTNGQRRTVHLPDGSIVTLNVASRLRVPSGFASATSRSVELEGEAVFNVTPNANRAFSVRAGGENIKVLGTVFSVRAYPGAKNGNTVPAATETRVAVASGRVNISNNTLSAGDMAIAKSSGAIQVTHVANVDDQFGWTTGKQTLRDVPVREVAVELQRWYNLRVEIGSEELASRLVTTTLNTEPLTPSQLDDLAAAFGARVERLKNGTVRLVSISDQP